MAKSKKAAVAAKCLFPNCGFHPGDNGYCPRHSSYGSKTAAKIYRIPRESAKRKKDNIVYKAVKKEKMAEGILCELKSPVCTIFAQGMDHLQKTSPGNRTKKENLKRACNACNDYKEENPKWAEENGFAISRFKKTEAK